MKRSIFLGFAVAVILSSALAHADGVLSLVVVEPDDGFVSFNEWVVVELRLSDMSEPVSGCQVVLGYDPSLLTCMDVVPGNLYGQPPWNFLITGWWFDGQVNAAFGYDTHLSECGMPAPGEYQLVATLYFGVTNATVTDDTTIWFRDPDGAFETMLSRCDDWTEIPDLELVGTDPDDIFIDNIKPSIEITSITQDGVDLKGTGKCAGVGDVIVVVEASDDHSGLDGDPVLVAKDSANNPITVNGPTQDPTGTFVYIIPIDPPTATCLATLTASVFDNAGNGKSTTSGFEVDVTKPSVEIVSITQNGVDLAAPDTYAGKGSVIVVVEASDAKCGLDGDPILVATDSAGNPITVTGPAAGTFTYTLTIDDTTATCLAEVTATACDKAVVPNCASDTKNFDIDVTPPSISIVSITQNGVDLTAPDTYAGKGEVVVVVNASDDKSGLNALTFEAKDSAGNDIPYTEGPAGTFTLTISDTTATCLAEVAATACDKAVVPNCSSDTKNFDIDVKPPVISIASITQNGVDLTAPDTYAGVGSVIVLVNTSDDKSGPGSIAFEAKDSAGNDIPYVENPAGTFTLTISDTTATCLATVTASVCDKAVVPNCSSDTKNFEIDVTPPSISIASITQNGVDLTAPDTYAGIGSVTVVVNASDDKSGLGPLSFEAKDSAGNDIPYVEDPPGTFTLTISDTTATCPATVTASVEDLAVLANEASDTKNFNVDVTDPVIEIVSITQNGVELMGTGVCAGVGDVIVVVEASDAKSGLGAIVLEAKDSAGNHISPIGIQVEDPTGTFTYTLTIDGTTATCLATVTASVCDKAVVPNCSSGTGSFCVDVTKPDIEIVSITQNGVDLTAADTWAGKGSVIVVVEASDAKSGLDGDPILVATDSAGNTITVTGPAEAPAGTFTYTLTIDDTTATCTATLDASVCDRAVVPNCSSDTDSFEVDVTDPVIQIVSITQNGVDLTAADTWAGEGSVIVVVEASDDKSGLDGDPILVATDSAGDPITVTGPVEDPAGTFTYALTIDDTTATCLASVTASVCDKAVVPNCSVDTDDFEVDVTPPVINIVSITQGGEDLIGCSINAIQGEVLVEVQPSDAKSGLGTFTFSAKDSAGNDIPVDPPVPGPGGTYRLTIDETTANGTATVTVSVCDKAVVPNCSSDSDSFCISKNEITGLITLQSLNPGSLGRYREVTFKATDAGGNVIKTWKITIHFDQGVKTATYTLTDVPAGTAALSAKTNWNLRRKICGLDMSANNGQAVADFINSNQLLGGDIDGKSVSSDVLGDNICNILDYGCLKANWHKNENDNPECTIADINGDGLINLNDYTIIRLNFFVMGDPE